MAVPGLRNGGRLVALVAQLEAPDAALLNGAMLSLVFGFARWSRCSKATPYSTIAPGMLMVFMRPPSLEPSTPEVSEPRE